MKVAVYFLICCFMFLSFSSSMKANQEPPLIFSVTVVPNEESISIQLILYNNSSNAQRITFPTSQFFDFSITSQSGEVVYENSEGKYFLQALQKIYLKPGETKVWEETWNYQHKGKRVSEGAYTLQAHLYGENLSGFSMPLRTSKLFNVPEANPSFKNVKVTYNKDEYMIRGQANVSNGSFYYSVEDGHQVILKETLIKVNKEAPHWTEFSFVIPKEKVESHNCFLLLYERDEKDGKVIHTYVMDLSK